MKKLILSCVITVVANFSNGVFAAPPTYSVEQSTIGDLLDNPKTREILDKYIPGLTKSEQIDMARGMTLKAIQPFAADELTEEKLAKVDAELVKLPADKK